VLEHTSAPLFSNHTAYPSVHVCFLMAAKYRVGQKCTVCWTYIKMFSCLPGVRLVLGMSPYLNILCTSSVKLLH